MDSAILGAGGIPGDRQYALIDAVSGLPAAPERDIRWRKALHLQTKSIAGQYPAISFPDGDCRAVNDPSLLSVLADYFGFAVGIATHEPAADDLGFPLIAHRHEHFPLHVLTTSSLQQLATLRQVEAVDVRRFRPSVLVEVSEPGGFLENQWIGGRVRLGDVELRACEATKRCGITMIAQPGLDEDPEILRNLVRHNKRNLGIYCSLERAGSIRQGDVVSIGESTALSYAERR